ncbi:MAG: flagellar hook basal-body protein [Phycisphaerae bacterium]|nr:flagellar hook basal-body protein [Phycisphaerae bacterium]
MSYGLQISASGAASALYRQDVHANNLANMDTVGFKPDIPSQRPRDDVRTEDGLWFMPSDVLLERLGGGVMLKPNLVDHGQGAIRESGNPLDLAIDGEGFFVLRPPIGSDPSIAHLTRDGRFTRNGAGQLVSVSTGAPVLDAQNRPVLLPPGPAPTVESDGTLRQGGAIIGRLRVMNPPDTGTLRKAGNGVFEVSAAAVARAGPAPGRVCQGAVEESSVSEIKSLMAVTGAAREVDANISMIQQHDRLMERAINSLGRLT